MDGVLSIIFLIVVYAFAFSVKGKGKGNKRASSAQKRSHPLPREAFAGQDARAVAAKRKKELRHSRGERGAKLQDQRDAPLSAMAQAAQALPKTPERRAEQTMLPDMEPRQHGMRYVRADQERMQAAGEGEDPCHVGTAPSHRRDPSQAEEERPQWRMSGEDVWRGVIMSEVLMRPQERAALRRARRRMP